MKRYYAKSLRNGLGDWIVVCEDDTQRPRTLHFVEVFRPKGTEDKPRHDIACPVTWALPGEVKNLAEAMAERLSKEEEARLAKVRAKNERMFGIRHSAEGIILKIWVTATMRLDKYKKQMTEIQDHQYHFFHYNAETGIHMVHYAKLWERAFLAFAYLTRPGTTPDAFRTMIRKELEELKSEVLRCHSVWNSTSLASNVVEEVKRGANRELLEMYGELAEATTLSELFDASLNGEEMVATYHEWREEKSFAWNGVTTTNGEWIDRLNRTVSMWRSERAQEDANAGRNA